MRHALLSLPALLIAASAANAGIPATALTSYGDQLYVTDLNGNIQNQFTMSDDITSMAVHPNGTIFASSRTDDDMDGKYELYTISNPTTAPTLNLVGDFLDANTPALTFINGGLFGFQSAGGGAADFLVQINTGTNTQSPVGATGEVGGTVSLSATGYDPATDTLYGLGKSALGPLWDVDYSNAPDPSTSLIGNSGVNTGNEGAEFWAGELYHAFFNFNSSSLLFGTRDTTNGAFNQLNVLETGIDGSGQVGLAIIPTPGTLAIAGLGGLIAIRRKR